VLGRGGSVSTPRLSRRTVSGFEGSHFNKDTTDAAAPLGKGEMTILKEMESFDREHDQYMEGLKSGSRPD